MGTEVLRSQDCLRTPRPSTPSRSPSPWMRSVRHRKKRREGGNVEPVAKLHNLIMGQVTILKRGEQLMPAVHPSSDPPAGPASDQPANGSPATAHAGREADDDTKKPEFELEDTLLYSTDRLGPEPEMVPRRVRVTEATSAIDVHVIYAGSGFVSSPAPSSLPLPAFSTPTAPRGPGNDRATEDLKKLLRLDVM